MTRINRLIQPNMIYSTADAANVLGTSERTLNRRIKSGEIQAKKVGKSFKMLGENILNYMGASEAVASGVSSNMTNAETDPKKFK